MIQIVGDTHTHTIASDHAYSTLLENINWAKQLGHRFIAVTDHTGGMPGAPYKWHFETMRGSIPREVNGLVVLRGCETNILPDGTVDLPENILADLDWVIASMHRFLCPDGLGEDAYTQMWLKVAENPLVDVIGHMGQPCYPCDYDRVVKAFAQHNKIVEINAGSFRVRKGSEINCLNIARLCKEYGVDVVVSTDAHFCTTIGEIEDAARLLEEAEFPEERILNADYQRFCKALEQRKGIILPR